MPGMELIRKRAAYCGGDESFWHEEHRSARRMGTDLHKLRMLGRIWGI